MRPFRPVLAAILAVALAAPLLSPPAAQAQSRLKALIDRLRGDAMPEGIVKTNGRIEATQVDVSSKYAGRLAEVTVKEGDEVKKGDLLAEIERAPQLEGVTVVEPEAVLEVPEAIAAADA